jgi:hypothetical protein
LAKSYAAIRSIGLDSAGRVRNESASRLLVVDSAGRGSLCGLIFEAADSSDYASFRAFQDTVLKKTSIDKSQLAALVVGYKNIAGETIKVTYQPDGTIEEPLYDWGYGPTTPQVGQFTPPFIQPSWPSGPGFGRVASWTVNNTPVDVTSTWPAITGANLTMDGNVLRWQEGTLFYNIDYTGTIPVFTTNTTALAGALDKEAEAVPYPNPVTDHLFLPIEMTAAGSVDFRIIDAG